MISSFLALGFWLTSASSSWPDPYIGMSFRTFPEKHLMGVDATTGNDIIRTRRRKFLQVGLPFEIKKFSWGDAGNMKMILLPESLFSLDVVILNATVGIEQDIRFSSYRSVPSGLFWGIAGGLHYGFIVAKKDLINQDSGKPLSFVDRTSLATVLKFYFGPTFDLNKEMALKLRMGTDLMFGKIGPFQTRTSVSEALGSVLGLQLQLDFR